LSAIKHSGGPVVKFNLLDFLLPRETKFYTMFRQQVDYLVRASVMFRELATNLRDMKEDELRNAVTAIHDVEHQADIVEAKIIDELAETFITPFDREDIHALAVSIDNAIDMVNNLAHRLDIFRVRKLSKNALAFVTIIVDTSQLLKRLIEDMEYKRPLDDTIKAIHSFENSADYLFSLSIADLFDKEKNPLDVIKLKEIYEMLEKVVNAMDTTSKLIRRIAIKQG